MTEKAFYRSGSTLEGTSTSARKQSLPARRMNVLSESALDKVDLDGVGHG